MPYTDLPAIGLAALRAKLDHIDDAVHDLLMQRAKVVEQVARTGKPAAFRPGREASIVRRLLGRHQGPLPPASLLRIWRELLAGTTSMQGDFSLAISNSNPPDELTQLAREHFGALTPLCAYGNVNEALAAVGRGSATVAVLPFPSDTETWWVAMLAREPRLYVVSRLPFWRTRPQGAAVAQALVVAAAPPDASDNDRTLLALTCDSGICLARLAEDLGTAGLSSHTTAVLRQHGAPTTHVLIEIEGYLTDTDSRLGLLRPVRQKPLVLGSYAVPYEEPTR